MKKLTILLIAIYQNFISNLLRILFGPGCRFTPTCSDYSKEAINRFGVGKGTILTISRILRCHPGEKGGFDPIPS